MTQQKDRGFVDLEEASAPEEARRLLAATKSSLGFVPSALARMAHSPPLVRAFQHAVAAFDRTSFTPVEREVAITALAHHVGCEVCIALHARTLAQLGAAEHAAKLASGEALGDPRLEAIAATSRALFHHAGDVDEASWRVWLDAGYTREQALELLIGVGAYTMSTFANRLTAAPLDPELATAPQLTGSRAADSAGAPPSSAIR